MRPRQGLRTKLFHNSPTRNTGHFHQSSSDVPETDAYDVIVPGESEALEGLLDTKSGRCNLYFDNEFTPLGDSFVHSCDDVRSTVLSPIDKLLQSDSEKESSDSSNPVHFMEANGFMNSTSMDSVEEKFLQEVLLCEPQSAEPPKTSIRSKTKKRRRKLFYNSRRDRQFRRKDSEDCAKNIRGRGLRHISMSVTRKMELKEKTTYEKVADEVIAEFIAPDDPRSGDKLIVAKKNIRRRVYDTLNVLNALNLLSKKKREVRWLNQQSVPTKSGNLAMKSKDRLSKLENNLKMKYSYLQELDKKMTGLQNLMDRNQMNYNVVGYLPEKYIMLPFTLVEIPVHAAVEWKWSDDRGVFYVDGSRQLLIHDDECVIKALEKSGNEVQHSQPCETFDFDENFLVNELTRILSDNEGTTDSERG